MGRILGFTLSALFTLTAVSLLGADATGKWAGTLTVVSAYGGDNPGPALLVLKQDGSRLTGTAGPDVNSQLPIQNGKVENGTLTFEIAPNSGAIMKFVLKQDGNEMKGEVEGERGGQKQTGKLAVKREK